MNKIIRILLVLVIVFIMAGCENTITTRNIEHGININDDPIDEPIINDEPAEEEIKKWNDFLTSSIYSKFYCNIFHGYIDKEIENAFEYRQDIDYTNKIHFGYVNKYIDGCNKTYLPLHDNIVIYIENYCPPILYESRKELDSYNRLVELMDLMDYYDKLYNNGEIDILEYIEIIQGIENEISDLNQIIDKYLDLMEIKWFRETFDFVNNSYSDFYDRTIGGGVLFYASQYSYQTIEQLNEHLEALNDLSKEDWVLGVYVIRDFGELLGASEIIECAKEILEYEKEYEEQFGIAYNYLGSLKSTVDYYTFCICVLEDQRWEETMYHFYHRIA